MSQLVEIKDGIHTVRTVDGETFDLLVWRHYEDVERGLALVLEANPHLRAAAAVLPIGSLVSLPSLPPAPKAGQIRLWS